MRVCMQMPEKGLPSPQVGSITGSDLHVATMKAKVMRCLHGIADGADAGASAAQVGIIMGSDSDLATMKAAAEVLRDFGIAAEVTVVSAHRTPDRMLEYARDAHKRGVKVRARVALSPIPVATQKGASSQ